MNQKKQKRQKKATICRMRCTRHRRKTCPSAFWKQGAITVEAAYLVPWTVLLIALLIILVFFVHNRTWYTAAALEAGLSGNQYLAGAEGSGRAGRRASDDTANPAGTQKAQQTVAARIQEQTMPGSAPAQRILCTNARTEVSFSEQRYPLFSSLPSWEVTESVHKVCPVSLIRTKWTLQHLLQKGEGGDG